MCVALCYVALHLHRGISTRGAFINTGFQYTNQYHTYDHDWEQIVLDNFLNLVPDYPKECVMNKYDNVIRCGWDWLTACEGETPLTMYIYTVNILPPMLVLHA